jgi:hypothetical protein
VLRKDLPHLGGLQELLDLSTDKMALGLQLKQCGERYFMVLVLL